MYPISIRIRTRESILSHPLAPNGARNERKKPQRRLVEGIRAIAVTDTNDKPRLHKSDAEDGKQRSRALHTKCTHDNKRQTKAEMLKVAVHACPSILLWSVSLIRGKFSCMPHGDCEENEVLPTKNSMENKNIACRNSNTAHESRKEKIVNKKNE